MICLHWLLLLCRVQLRTLPRVLGYCKHTSPPLKVKLSILTRSLFVAGRIQIVGCKVWVHNACRLAFRVNTFGVHFCREI